MSKLHGLAVLVSGLMLLSGCASGVKYEAMAPTMAPVPPNTGRIFFYRDGSPVGSAVQPDIKLNERKVGKSVPGGFFYVDEPAGNCVVSCSTEAKKNLSFTLEPGEKRFVRTRVSMGVMVGHVTPSLEDEATALKTLSGAKYTGEKKGQ